MLDAIARQTGCATAPRADGDQVAALTSAVEVLSQSAGLPVRVDAGVLTERAALMGLAPAGALSANGMCRMIRARDGWLAVNLPRADDADLLPAWLGIDGTDDPWARIATAALTAPAEKLVADARVLGLAVARVNEPLEPRWSITRMGKAGARRPRPRVLDMSSLWAGPLCGALLAEAGADVIKLESTSRPDGARFGHAGFFARLNGRKRTMTLDLPRERDALRGLFADVDIVIESARPRVLTQWGFSLPEIFAANPHLIWISITAYGRDEPRANWIGFGDEVAAAAGLVVESESGPMFVGDAIADPLAGLGAAASAFACLAAGGGFLVDANLFAAASYVANAPTALP